MSPLRDNEKKKQQWVIRGRKLNEVMGFTDLPRVGRNLPSVYHGINPITVIQTFSIILSFLEKSSIYRSK